MLQTRINFSGQKNATMLTVRFFSNKTNTILERNLIVDQKDDRQSVLDYLAESLGEINILQYSSKNVLCIAERSRLEKAGGTHRLEHFWGDVISYIVECVDKSGIHYDLHVIGNVDSDDEEIMRAINEMSDELSIINIYEYKDCWLKREDILLQALWNELDSSKKFVQLENDFTLQVTYQSMKEYEFFLSLWKPLIHRIFLMVSNTFLL